MAATQGVFYLSRYQEPTLTSWAIVALVTVSAIALVAGFMTPAAAAGLTAGMLCIVAVTIRPAGATALHDGAAALLVIVDALALAVLGPGAYSVDAYFFGRREIVIPDTLRRR